MTITALIIGIVCAGLFILFGPVGVILCGLLLAFAGFGKKD